MSAHARAPTSTGVHHATMKLSTEIFRLTQQMAIRDARWIPRQPRAPCPTRFVATRTARRRVVRSSSTQSRSRKRSTEPSGTDPPIHSVAGPGPAPAFSLRRPSSSPMEIRHRRWRVGIAASTDCWLLASDLCCRPTGVHGTSVLREAPPFQTTQVASRPAAGRPANSIVGLRTRSRRSRQGPLRWPSASLDCR